MGDTIGLALNWGSVLQPLWLDVARIGGMLAVAGILWLIKWAVSHIKNTALLTLINGLVMSAEKKFATDLSLGASNSKREWVEAQAAKMGIKKEFVDAFLDSAVLQLDPKPGDSKPNP